MATMGTTFKSVKLEKEDFDKLTIIEKRNYLLQEDEYETMWYSRTVNKLICFSLLATCIMGAFILITNAKK